MFRNRNKFFSMCYLIQLFVVIKITHIFHTLSFLSSSMNITLHALLIDPVSKLSLSKRYTSKNLNSGRNTFQAYKILK